MSWISFVIVTLFFYLPCIGQGRFIQEQSVRLPDPFGVIPIPFSGYFILLFLSLFLWGVLWSILRVLEKTGMLPLFRWDALRNGFLFAMHPIVSTSFAMSLAWYIFGANDIAIALDGMNILLQTILDALTLPAPELKRLLEGANILLRVLLELGRFLRTLLEARELLEQGINIVRITMQGVSLLLEVLNLVPGVKDVGLYFLSIFTLIVAYFFQRERASREGEEIRRNLLIRKKKQREIVIAPGQ